MSVRTLLLACCLAASPTLASCAPKEAIAANLGALRVAAAAPSRTAANVSRDRYRHPVETLAFFGVRPGDTVVEIWPGGGWYSEILIPYLAQGGGTYVGAAPESRMAGLRKLVAANPAAYATVRTANFPVLAAVPGTPVAPGSADVVLTFRNVHNWMMGKEPFEAEAFRQMYAMLKPGGTLGVVEHRLPENADAAREKTSGYVKASTVRRLAEAAGFRLVATSEINANPLDKTDHPEGVWTLPPNFRLGDKDRARYAVIGESDRMTLKFVKPR